MEQHEEQAHVLRNQLAVIAATLPADKIAEIVDFAQFLQAKYGGTHPPVGSAAAILRALDAVGPLEFEAGELEALLTEIAQQREVGADTDG